MPLPPPRCNGAPKGSSGAGQAKGRAGPHPPADTSHASMDTALVRSVVKHEARSCLSRFPLLRLSLSRCTRFLQCGSSQSSLLGVID